jgi:uncharacterized protein YecE (DUF72 family)
MPEIFVGCSGWNYRHWRGAFYPEKMRSREWFQFYATHFDSVEINNTFYNLPEESVFDDWRAQAPPGFSYAVKASRFLTHMKKLKDPHEPVERLISRARRLGPHLGPILYQLPPRWRANPERLRGLLEILPRDLVHVFEFRDVSWYNDAIGTLLIEHGASLCTHDFPGSAVTNLAFGPIAYARFHGANGPYWGRYSDAALAPWVEWLVHEHRGGRGIYVYFNNDSNAEAIADARRMRNLLRIALGR